MRNFIFLLLLFFYPAVTVSQSNVNPDISLIGSFNLSSVYNKNSENNGKLLFHDPALEMIVEGYLNPYSKAAGIISYEDGNFEVEELYAHVVRGLPLDAQIKAGKFLVGFGKLNTTHPHTWPFISRPLFHQIYFGEEGFNDIGINLSFILPTGDIFTTFDAGIFKGDALAGSAQEEDTELLRGNSPVFTCRLGSFFSINDFNNIEAGVSASYGTYATLKYLFIQYGDLFEAFSLKNESLKYLYTGIDFKYKYKPDSYTALTIQGEAILNSRQVYSIVNEDELVLHKKNIHTFGAFIYLDYLFKKIFSIGARYDFTNGVIGAEPSELSLANDDQNNTQALSGWFGFYPVEETLAIRLGLEQMFFNYYGGDTSTETKAFLQLIFSLGPHKAHPF